MNVQSKSPKALHAEARRWLKKMSAAPARLEYERLHDEYVVDLSAEGRTDAAESVVRDWESFVSFYDFPTERWVRLRTTNPLESVFGAACQGLERRMLWTGIGFAVGHSRQHHNKPSHLSRPSTAHAS